jgi:hypothetical protein
VEFCRRQNSNANREAVRGTAVIKVMVDFVSYLGGACQPPKIRILADFGLGLFAVQKVHTAKQPPSLAGILADLGLGLFAVQKVHTAKQRYTASRPFAGGNGLTGRYRARRHPCRPSAADLARMLAKRRHYP